MFFLASVIGLCGCEKGKPGSAAASPHLSKSPPKAVRVVAARQLSVEETVYATGTLAAQDRAVLSAKVPGGVEAVEVDFGASVRKGDLLARIQKRDFELRRQQAEAALAQARARLGLALTGEEDAARPEEASLVKEARAVLAEASKNRGRLLRLKEQGIIPEAEVETAEAQYQVALHRYDEATHEAKNRMAALRQRQAELDMASQELRDTELRAPFDGVVEQRQTSPGEFLSVGTPILTLVRIDPIRLRLEVSERDAPRIRLEQKTEVWIEGLSQPLEGRISRLSPVISAGNRMLLAEADLPNPSGLLRPGSFAKADIVVNPQAPGIFVPKSAVSTFAGIQKVFVFENGQASEREVTLKRDRGDEVEVVRGVQAGERVVAEPGNLRNGQPLEALATET